MHLPEPITRTLAATGRAPAVPWPHPAAPIVVRCARNCYFPPLPAALNCLCCCSLLLFITAISANFSYFCFVLRPLLCCSVAGTTAADYHWLLLLLAMATAMAKCVVWCVCSVCVF